MKTVAALLGGALLGCGSDGDDDTTGSGASSNAGGSSAGGSSAGGSGAGGSSAGGSGAGGSSAGACALALMARGSNYATDPHDLTIPIADIEAGVSKTYTTTGIGHTHTVTLTDADFAALRNGETVKKYVCYTDPGFTDHEFVVSCADPNVMPTFEGEIGTAGNCPA